MKVCSRMQMIIRAVLLFSIGLTAAWDNIEEPADVQLYLAEEDLYLATEPPQPRKRRQADELEDGSGEDELTTEAPSYPAQPPVIADAVYSFTVDFKITSMNISDFNPTVNKTFTDLLTKSFNGTPGFKEIIITNTTPGSVNVATSCGLGAAEAHEEAKRDKDALQNSVLAACAAVMDDPRYDIQNDTNIWLRVAAQVSEKAVSLCSAEDVTCPWGHKCNGNVCEHHCSKETCGGNGICSVQGASGGIVVCKCVHDDFYHYSGQKCTESVLRWETVLPISGGVGGAVAILLGVFLGIMYCRHRRRTMKDGFSVNSSQDAGSERQSRVYQRWDTMKSSRGFGRNMFMPSYFASTTSPGVTPSFKLYRSEGRTGSVWGANEIDEQFPDFEPRLDHIDTEVDYAITRPQLRL